jgi:hypothetical protein
VPIRSGGGFFDSNESGTASILAALRCAKSLLRNALPRG